MSVLSWRTFFLLTSFLLFALPAQAEKTLFEQQLDRVVKHSKLNGAIAGEITHSGDWKLYIRGYADVEKNYPVTLDDTVFAIASTTKAMIATGILILRDEGELSLDDPVINHLPEFKIDSPLTPFITIRDLITHTVPLPGSIGLFDWYYQYPMKEKLPLLKNFDLQSRFRDDFIYQNITWDLAGLLIERVSGQPWGQFLTQRLWQPLGMTNTYGSTDEVPAHLIKAEPAYYRDSELTRIDPMFSPTLPNAAGSVWSTADNIMRWLSFTLTDGVADDGSRILSKASMRELFTPQVVNNGPPFYSFEKEFDNHWQTYSLGWFQIDVADKKLDYHSGSLRGFSGMMGLFRDHNKAMFFFTNTQKDKLEREVMLASYIDALDGSIDKDWIPVLQSHYDEEVAPYYEYVSELKQKRVANTESTFELDAYTGRYINSKIGEVIVKEVDNKLYIVIGEIERPLSHWHYDQFAFFMPTDPGPHLVEFDIGADGKIAQFRGNNDIYVKQAADKD